MAAAGEAGIRATRVGTRHRLENAGEAPLLIIEVQSGSYLGEDDIERFDDRYNRGQRVLVFE